LKRLRKGQTKSAQTLAWGSTAVTHIAIAELVDGKAVDWMEKVTDQQYGLNPFPKP